MTVRSDPIKLGFDSVYRWRTWRRSCPNGGADGTWRLGTACIAL